MSNAAPSFSLRLGRLARPHGLQGGLRLQLFRTRPQRALDHQAKKIKTQVELEFPDGRTEAHRFTRIRWQGPGQAIVHFAGIDDRDAAEALVTAYVDVDPHQASEALVDEVDQTMGALVRDVHLGDIGVVRALRDNGAQALMVIESEHEILIPYVDGFITGFEQKDGQQVILTELPDGLVELNKRNAD